MKKLTITKTGGKKIDKYLFDIEKDKCPLCGEKLKKTYGTWNMFHGEISRNCCNSPWQTKDFSPPDGEEETYKEYFNEVNKKNINSLSIDKKLWKPIKEAFKKHGINDCQDNTVYNEVKHLLK